MADSFKCGECCENHVDELDANKWRHDPAQPIDEHGAPEQRRRAQRRYFTPRKASG